VRFEILEQNRTCYWWSQRNRESHIHWFREMWCICVDYGYHVEAGNRLVSQMISDGGRVTFTYGDVSSEDDLMRVVTGTVGLFGSIDVLINNVGIGWTGTLLERSTDDWRKVTEVNLTGPYLMAKYCSPYLATSKGSSIINIVSTRALMSVSSSEPCSTSKGGLLAHTHLLAIILGLKVRVNAICSG